MLARQLAQCSAKALPSTSFVRNSKYYTTDELLVETYSKNFREFNWTIGLFIARLYMWLNVFYDTKIKRKHYNDAWERVESTK